MSLYRATVTKTILVMADSAAEAEALARRFVDDEIVDSLDLEIVTDPSDLRVGETGSLVWHHRVRPVEDITAEEAIRRG